MKSIVFYISLSTCSLLVNRNQNVGFFFVCVCVSVSLLSCDFVQLIWCLLLNAYCGLSIVLGTLSTSWNTSWK